MTKPEIVHAVLDYFDGPIRGVADFQGHAHYFEAVFDEEADEWKDEYLLVGLQHDAFQWVLEDWAIWRRWEDAFYAGRVARGTHSALPEDRDRHVVLTELLASHLRVAPGAVRLRATFRPRAGTSRPVGSIRDLEVIWHPVP